MTALINKSIITVPDAGLSKFSFEEANQSVLVKADKYRHKIDGSSTFQYWIIQIRDADGNYYEWKDHSLSSLANKTQIRSAVMTHLQENVDKLPYSQLNEISEDYNNSVVPGGSTEGVGNTMVDNATL
tara:strand:- start:12945 stop:13328 length:384 start_codon:yes stop_codon:yes gene_type:complete